MNQQQTYRCYVATWPWLFGRKEVTYTSLTALKQDTRVRRNMTRQGFAVYEVLKDSTDKEIKREKISD